ncbi:hypothetical protein CRYUN_Cryun11dG0011800 [Craigia yunnanensis]
MVLIGYGHGLFLGLSIGYVAFQTGNPKWFVTFVKDHVRLKEGPTVEEEDTVCVHGDVQAFVIAYSLIDGTKKPEVPAFSGLNSVSYRKCDDACTKSYPKIDSWKEGIDCCSWDGVTCDNKKGQVIGLDLSCSWLYGTITSNNSLFHLPHLQKLNLAFNDFNNSKMSSEFGRFASLVYLSLSNTFFSRQVPPQLSHLSKLVSLDLSMIDLFWSDYQTLEEHTLKGLVENLTEVRQLVFDGINMSSINPNVLMNLSSSLRSLSLHACDLRGKFSKDIFDLPNLKLLDLSDNLMLSLNFSKFNWSSHQEHLDLSWTSFSTELIDSIDNLQSLEHLVVSNAFFSGGLPDSTGNLVSLKHMDLYNSKISGSIPRSLGNLSQLRYLILSRNRFSRQLPSSLTNLTELEVLHIHDNILEGSIPDEVTVFLNLIDLDLSTNLFNGTLPSWLYVASSLKHISLFENQLSGQIKEFHCKSVEEIYLENNKLQGLIPSSISQLVNLTYLGLSSNNLSGTLEFGMFSKFQNLQFLDVSQNSPSLNCNGTSADFTLPNLQTLLLPSCNINEFPQFLRSSKRLRDLDLSNNKIYGKIPNWMWDVGNDSLSYLNLSYNSLTEVEKLPWKEISVLDLSSNLIQLDLPIPPTETNVFLISNNSLTGEISSQICNASYLKILDLSHNNLSGIIPQCFGNLSKTVLTSNLRKNKLYGILPPIFANECQLSNLNVNGNQLQGSLTRSISNCRDLELLDLGNNKINDTFPYWLGSLPQLQVLVLHSNQFHGSIHGTISNHSFLKIQIFDLSNNYFNGPLPVIYIRNFKAMINHTGAKSGISYMGMSIIGGFYSHSIAIAMKGLEMELVKIFTMLTSIDLSNNKFEGEIPKLVGTIPDRLLDLTSLSFFNVSENQLGGRIPQGKQFNTFGNDSYDGNKGLCGFPVSKGCSINESPPPQLPPSNLPEKANFDFGWKVVLIGYGCGLMFGLAVGYVGFQTGKPIWFVSSVEDQYLKRRRKSKIGNRCGGGRRT